MDPCTFFFCRAEDCLAQDRTERVCKSHMGNDSLPEEGALALRCPVDELVWDDDMAGLNLLRKAPYGAHGNDLSHPQPFHTKDIGAEIQLRGKQSVSFSMSREKNKVSTIQGSRHVRI
jgi:hypothetical protein